MRGLPVFVHNAPVRQRSHPERRVARDDGGMNLDDGIRFDDSAALIVIDVQQGFDDPSWGARDNPAAEANIGRLVTA